VSQPAVELRDLRKCYGALAAVDGVSLTVQPGDVYGYLGPNGAGKTTSLRMMLGLIQPTSGVVQLFGRDPMIDPVAALEGVAGFVEEPAFYPYLSGRRNLELLAALDGGAPPQRLDEVLAIVELAGRSGDRLREYSHGMRQRLGIAAALLRSPRLLVLDEPATGLDPAGMRDMRELVRGLAGQGITILLSSHLMLEVEHLCNRLAIIHRGRIGYEGGLEELLARATGRYRLEAADPGRAAGLCRSAAGIRDVSLDDGRIRFAAEPAAVASLTVELGRAGVGIHALVPSAPGLEELFFEITEAAERER
jgi:ABC-2 type transport system ATP-binding protein